MTDLMKFYITMKIKTDGRAKGDPEIERDVAASTPDEALTKAVK